MYLVGLYIYIYILLITYLLSPWSRVLHEKLTGFAVNQEIPRILWNPKDHYRTHKRPPPVYTTLFSLIIFLLRSAVLTLGSLIRHFERLFIT